jgi:vacuolar iron transporter family protein
MKDTAPLFREITFGLEDSLVSTLGAVTGIAAGTSNTTTILLAGTVYVAVESLAMIAGSYLSTKTQKEIELHELGEEEKILITNPKSKYIELDRFLTEKGLRGKLKTKFLRIISHNRQWMLEEIAVHELGISPQTRENPNTNSIVMGVSYVLGGLVPIIPYAFLNVSTGMVTSIVFTLIAITGMGVMKAKTGGTSITKNVLEVLIISSFVTLVGYLVGQLIGNILQTAQPL